MLTILHNRNPGAIIILANVITLAELVLQKRAPPTRLLSLW
jgi:hypothetical protein